MFSKLLKNQLKVFLFIIPNKSYEYSFRQGFDIEYSCVFINKYVSVQLLYQNIYTQCFFKLFKNKLKVLLFIS